MLWNYGSEESRLHDFKHPQLIHCWLELMFHMTSCLLCVCTGWVGGVPWITIDNSDASPCAVHPKVSTPAVQKEDTIVTEDPPLMTDALLDCSRQAFNFRNGNKSFCFPHAWDTCRGRFSTNNSVIQVLHWVTEHCQKGNPHWSVQRCPRQEVMFSQLESLGIYRKDSSLQKNGDCVFTKRRVCLCRPDVYKKLVDWRGALLEADECYLCIWYMLVDFQLITKKKTGVPAQQGGLAWRREMLRGSIRKYLPPV